VQHTRPLHELRRDDEPHFGGKSASLGELLAADIPVPPGFALSTRAFDGFLVQAGLTDTIAEAMANVEPGDRDGVAAAARTISEAMQRAPVPDSVRAELGARYAELAEAAGIAEPPVAVRSSALGEDSQDATFAGQQETYLWVRGVDQVCDAVRDCWVSLYSPTAVAYRSRLGHALQDAAMGVTVQLMVDAERSGVMFTCNPVSGDRSMVAINASWGLGLAVVGGEVTPDDYLVSKVTREVVRAHINSKQLEYVPDPDGSGTVRVQIPPDRQDLRCLDDGSLGALVAIGRRVERHFGAPQDIEWAIARSGELPESLFVLQSRPVTALPEPAKPQPAGASAISLVMGTFGVNTAKRDS
jgi:phosphoenolpyruvate synthase/pyruvate phosphate dikinase